MRPIQREIIAALGSKPSIDLDEEVRNRVDFLTSYVRSSGATGFALGISGGQDSTLAGFLCKRAVDELLASGLSSRFVAIRLPYGTQADEEDAKRALEFIAPQEQIVFNIKDGVDAIEREYSDAVGTALTDFGKGNVKARARMIAQYAVANDSNLLVVGTDHAAEAVTGFFTKHGDGGADILPLSGLTKRQGRALLVHLGAPEEIYTKAPTADLLDLEPGQLDEANLGLTYDVIDDYLEGREVSEAEADQIEQRYRVTEHKRAAPVTPRDDWWKKRA